MKKLFLLVLAAVFLFAGCFPLQNELAENAREITEESPVLSPSGSQSGSLSCALYYQYNSENLLSSEMVSLDLRDTTHLEEELLRALIAGPTAGTTGLRRVINPNTRVVSVELIAGTYYVTLTEDFLEPIQNLPDGWRNSTTWPTLVRNAQQLSAYSVVQTLLCRGTATRVQFMIAPNADSQGLRPTKGEMGFGDGTDDEVKMEPLAMDLSWVLRPETVVNSLLKAAKDRDWSRVEAFVSTGGSRPERVALMNYLGQETDTLESYALGRTEITPDGTMAVAIVQVNMVAQDGSLTGRDNIPLQLLREHDGWFVTWESLQLLWAEVTE